MALDDRLLHRRRRLGGVDAVAGVDERLGGERPAEDYHCQRDEQAERAQLPLRVHAEPGDGGGEEGGGVAGEGVGFAEGGAEAGAEGEVLLAWGC